MDLTIAPNNINIRLKLKRQTNRGILAETEQGLFTSPGSSFLGRGLKPHHTFVHSL